MNNVKTGYRQSLRDAISLQQPAAEPDREADPRCQGETGARIFLIVSN